MSDNHRWGANNSLSAYPLHFPQRTLRGASLPPARTRRQSESVLSHTSRAGPLNYPSYPTDASSASPAAPLPRNQKVHPSAFSASHSARNIYRSEHTFTPSQQKPAFFLPLNTPKDELDYNDITNSNNHPHNTITNDNGDIDDLYPLEEYDTFPPHHDPHYAAYYNALHTRGYSRPVSRSASPVRSSSFARQRGAHLDSIRRDHSNDYTTITTTGTISQSVPTRSLPMSIPMPSSRPEWFARPDMMMPSSNNSNSKSNNDFALDSDDESHPEERRGRCSLPRRVSISKQH